MVRFSSLPADSILLVIFDEAEANFQVWIYKKWANGRLTSIIGRLLSSIERISV